MLLVILVQEWFSELLFLFHSCSSCSVFSMACPACWILMHLSMDLEWGNQGATVSTKVPLCQRAHHQVMLFKGEGLALCQPHAL